MKGLIITLQFEDEKPIQYHITGKLEEELLQDNDKAKLKIMNKLLSHLFA